METVIAGKELIGGKARITVRFGPEATGFTEVFTVGSVDSLKRLVKARLAAIVASADVVNTLPDGAFDSTITDTAPTAEEVWFEKWGRLDRAGKLVDRKVVPESNAKYQALLAEVQTGLKAEYIDKL